VSSGGAMPNVSVTSSQGPKPLSKKTSPVPTLRFCSNVIVEPAGTVAPPKSNTVADALSSMKRVVVATPTSGPLNEPRRAISDSVLTPGVSVEWYSVTVWIVTPG
jgi:hypothetical protein